MKKFLLLLIFFLSFFIQNSNASNYLYYKLIGCESNYAVLFNIRGNESHAIDTAYKQQSGGFAFTNIEKYPAGMYVVQFNDSVYTELIFNGEDIVLEANIDNILMTMNVKKSQENLILFTYWQYAIYVKDSINKLSLKRQRLLQKNYGIENEVTAKLNLKIYEMNEKLYTYIREQRTLYSEAFAPVLLLSYQIPSYQRYLSFEDNNPYPSEKEFYQYHFFDNVDFSDARLLNTKVIYVSISDYLNNFGTPASTSNYNRIIDLVMKLASENDEVYYYCMNLFIQNFDNTIWEDVFVHIIDKYYRNSYVPDPTVAMYYFNKAEAIKKLKPGKKAPNFTLQDTSGNNVSLYDIKAKAKILVFYSSDCPHCEEAMPELKNIYKQYKNSGVEVIAVAIDDDASVWKNHIRKDSLIWINLSDLKGMSSPIISQYNIWMTPTIFILDKKNIIMNKPKGSTDIHTTLVQLIY